MSVGHKKRLTIVVALLMACHLGCAKDLVTGKKSYNWFSLQEDIRMGEDVMNTQIRSFKDHQKKMDDDADPAMTSRIRKITSRIGAVSHNPSFPYEAHYADEDVVNAWCAPGGKVMVYSGLFEDKKGFVKTDSDDELAAVLGHEIAHATARHVTEAMSRNYTLSTLGSVALSAISSSGTGAVQNVFSRALVEGVTLYIPFYSRTNEEEADRLGILYAAKAGYNPKAAVDLWYRACQKKGDLYSIYNSHPSNCQRAKDLEKLLPQAQVEYEKAKK